MSFTIYPFHQNEIPMHTIQATDPGTIKDLKTTNNNIKEQGLEKIISDHNKWPVL